MMAPLARNGILFVLSAPSGTGKTTLREALLRAGDLAYSVSCTTRPPRPGEVEGRDYFFLTDEEFRRRVEAGEFLEHARVHGAAWYGTPLGPVREHLRAGRDVLVDIDVRGAQQIRAHPDPVIRAALADVMVLPPSLEELRRRLEGRRTESPEQVANRLRTAEAEMRAWPEYRYVLTSGTREEDLQNFRAIVRAERYLSRRLRAAEQP